MVIAVSEETAVDYELTARIATEAFGSNDVVFAADRMKWLYERGFGQGQHRAGGNRRRRQDRPGRAGPPDHAMRRRALPCHPAHRSLYFERPSLAAIDPPPLQGNGATLSGAKRPLHSRHAERECQAAQRAPAQARAIAPAIGPRRHRIDAAAFEIEIFRLPQIPDEAGGRRSAVGLQHARGRERLAMGWRGAVRSLERPDLRLCDSCRRRPVADFIVAPDQGHQLHPALRLFRATLRHRDIRRRPRTGPRRLPLSGSVRCAFTPASTAGYQRFREFRCRRGCGLRCWFSCAIWLPESPRCDWTASS